jgi:hypothetical protein
MLSVLLGICAIAVDLSRLTVSGNELQTAVDAAALRGALARQNGTTDPTNAVTTFLAGANPVMGTNLSPQSITVEARRYEANGSWTATTFAATGNRAANAVRVIASQPGSLLFGMFVQLSRLVQRRAATARIAGAGLTCVKPWMFESVTVVGRHVNSPLNPPSQENYSSMRGAALASNSVQATRIHLAFAPPTDTRGNLAQIYGASSFAGKWIGVTLPGTASYQSTINTCNANALVAPYPLLQNAITNPSVVNTSVNQAFNGPGAICTGPNDTCQALVPVILGSTSAVFGDAGDYTVLYQTTYQLVCFKRSSSSDCPSAAGFVNWSAARAGTMFGYLDITLPVFSGNQAVSYGGSMVSTSQRLLLVE